MRRLTLQLTGAAAILFLLAFFTASAAASSPSVVKTALSALRENAVTFEGEINPGERFTKYHFEYGIADCAANPCTSIPIPDRSVPSGSVAVPVEKVEVSGLAEGTTYHFRLVASNVDGKAEGPDQIFKTFLAPPSFGPCPNDGLRLDNPMKKFIEYSSASLSDCRAYEQASPVDKNGSNATGSIAWVKASPDGGEATFLTTSGMEEAEGLQTELPTWLATKASGRWSTQGLFAPASSGQAVKILGWLPDLSAAFEYVRKEGPPKEAALLARDSSDRSLTEIVPYHTFTSEPSYSYVGASTDGQTVLFESNEDLAPGAAVGKSNVYAWDPGANTLRLASRLPDADCATAPCGPPAGAFGGAYAWMNQPATAQEGQKVTEEGGDSFGNYNQDLHAVSADGRYAYFTAARSGQLYVRLNPTEEQSPLEPSGKCKDPELACTLRVSASKKSDGGGLNGTDAAGPRPAAFMAASADGSEAFFTSAEKLTNESNTGPEPEAPVIARAGIGGEPESVDLKFLPQRATGLTTDGTHLYWANPVKGSIGRAKLDGDGPPSKIEEEFITRDQLEAEVEVEVEVEPDVFELQPQGFAEPRYVAVDGVHVYWTNATDGKDGKGVIGRAKLNGEGAASEPEPEFITGASNPAGIAVNAASTLLYWGNAGNALATRTIGRAELGGAEEVNQAFIQIDTGSQQLIPQGVAVNATRIYLAEAAGAGSYLVSYELSGDPSTEKFFFDGSVEPGAQAIALDASHVYWTRPGENSIGRIGLDLKESSPGLTPEFISDAGRPIGIAADAAHLYWSANQGISPNPGNDLYRFDAESGALEDLTPDLTDKNGAEVKGVLGTSADGSYVYFVANGVLTTGATAGNCVGGTSGDSIGYSGECNLYLYRAGEPLALITRLDGSGGSTGDATNWLPAAPIGSRLQKTSRVSPDGNTLLFRSRRQLDSYPNKGTPELYRYRVGEGIACISCSLTEAPPSRPAGLGSIAPPFLLPIRTAAVLSRNLSADGNRVFFETTEALVPGDTNGDGGCPEKGNPERFTFPICQDVYEWEAPGTGSCESAAQNGGCVYLLSTGKSNEASFFGDASADGNHAFVFTYARLVGQDQDQLADLYDASVDGGLKSQNEPPSPICTSTDSCGDSAGSAPPFQSPGSESFVGPGNPKPKPQGCPKGKRKVRSKGKTRCVAKHKKGKHHKGKSHKRTAKKTWRAAR